MGQIPGNIWSTFIWATIKEKDDVICEQQLPRWAYTHPYSIIRPWGYKTFFMLNSAEHEIFSANKYENANNSAFSYLLAEESSCLAMFSKTEFKIVSNLRFISRTNFMLSWVEHEKSFITSRPGRLLLVDIFYSIKWFCKLTRKALNRWT